MLILLAFQLFLCNNKSIEFTTKQEKKSLMDAKDAYIEQLENTIKKLQQQVENLTEMILILQKGKFGSSSEKTPKNYIQGQLSLFNEAEVYSVSPEPEPITKEVKGYTLTNTKQKE